VVDTIRSYTEVSPSGRGLRIFLTGKLPPHGRKKERFEVYETSRYVTVTGRHLSATPTTIETRQAELDRVHHDFFGKPANATGTLPSGGGVPADLDDTEIVRRAGEAKNGDKFKALWAGSTNGYASTSEADLALVNRLAFWTGPDPERIDSLFRQSGLFRSKWQRDDHRQRTIQKVLANRTEFYKARQRRTDGNGSGRHVYNGASGSGREGSKADKADQQGETADQPDAGSDSAPKDEPWEAPVPLGDDYHVPAFPLEVLPDVLARWAGAEADATQTPPTWPPCWRLRLQQPALPANSG
jgi:primase-polymerase (primpol)-like protein